MGTQTYIKDVLNAATTPSPARYAAAAADYDPDPSIDNGFFTGPFANQIIDRVFKTGMQEHANDLVVPQQGVYANNGHPSFPIANPLLFGKRHGVWHSGFFSRRNSGRNSQVL